MRTLETVLAEIRAALRQENKKNVRPQSFSRSVFADEVINSIVANNPNLRKQLNWVRNVPVAYKIHTLAAEALQLLSSPAKTSPATREPFDPAKPICQLISENLALAHRLRLGKALARPGPARIEALKEIVSAPRCNPVGRAIAKALLAELTDEAAVRAAEKQCAVARELGREIARQLTKKFEAERLAKQALRQATRQR